MFLFSYIIFIFFSKSSGRTSAYQLRMKSKYLTRLPVRATKHPQSICCLLTEKLTQQQHSRVQTKCCYTYFYCSCRSIYVSIVGGATPGCPPISINTFVPFVVAPHGTASMHFAGFVVARMRSQLSRLVDTSSI